MQIEIKIKKKNIKLLKKKIKNIDVKKIIKKSCENIAEKYKSL